MVLPPEGNVPIALRRVRSHRACQRVALLGTGIPVLLTTDFAGAPEGIVRASFPVLKKPYKLEELSAMMGNHFDRQE